MKKLFFVLSVCVFAACSTNTNNSTLGVDSTVTDKVSSDSISSGAPTDSSKMDSTVHNQPQSGSSVPIKSTTMSPGSNVDQGKPTKDSSSKDNWIDKQDKEVTKQGKMMKKY